MGPLLPFLFLKPQSLFRVGNGWVLGEELLQNFSGEATNFTLMKQASLSSFFSPSGGAKKKQLDGNQDSPPSSSPSAPSVPGSSHGGGLQAFSSINVPESTTLKQGKGRAACHYVGGGKGEQGRKNKTSLLFRIEDKFPPKQGKKAKKKKRAKVFCEEVRFFQPSVVRSFGRLLVPSALGVSEALWELEMA